MPNGWIVGVGAAAAVLLLAKRVAPALVNPKVQAFAEAIAYAEGFRPGTVPWRNNNPGDLKVSAVPSVGKDSQGHLIFASPEDGWRALRRQLQLIVDGQSRFTLEMTIAEMGARYAEWSGSWSHNVASRLGVTEGTTLRAVLV